MLLRRRPPRRGGSSGHSQTGKNIGSQEPKSNTAHQRRLNVKASTKASKPTASQRKEAMGSSSHFSAVSQSSRAAPSRSRPSPVASAGSWLCSSVSSFHGGLTNKRPLPI